MQSVIKQIQKQCNLLKMESNDEVNENLMSEVVLDYLVDKVKKRY